MATTLQPGDSLPSTCTLVGAFPFALLTAENGTLELSSDASIDGRPALAADKDDVKSLLSARGITVCDTGETDVDGNPVQPFMEAGHPLQMWVKGGVQGCFDVVSHLSSQLTLKQFAPSARTKVCRDSAGRLWTGYVDDQFDFTDSFLRVAYSDDNGQTWTHELVSHASGFVGHFVLAVDSQRNLHVAFSNDPSGSVQLYYRKRTHGSGFGSIQDLDTSPASNAAPSIAIDSNDQPHFAYAHRPPDAPTTQAVEIRYLDGVGGSTFDVTAVGGGSANDQKDPAIAIDGEDDVHVLWRGATYGSNPTKQNLQYRAKIGGTWQAREPVTDTSDDQIGLDLTLDLSDVPHATWIDGDPGSTTRYANRASGSWATEESFSLDSDSQKTSLSSDGSGTLHWFADDRVSGTIKFWTNDGSGWVEQSFPGNVGTARFVQTFWARWPESIRISSGWIATYVRTDGSPNILRICMDFTP